MFVPPIDPPNFMPSFGKMFERFLDMRRQGWAHAWTDLVL